MEDNVVFQTRKMFISDNFSNLDMRTVPLNTKLKISQKFIFFEHPVIGLGLVWNGIGVGC